MKTKLIFFFVLTLTIGICAGWFANAYSEKKIRKAQGIRALVDANDAAKRGDLAKAIEYAKYALILDENSPSANLADMQIKEWTKQRTEKMPSCK